MKMEDAQPWEASEAHRDRRVAGLGAAVAELARFVQAPAADLSALEQRAARALAGDEMLDRVVEPLDEDGQQVAGGAGRGGHPGDPRAPALDLALAAQGAGVDAADGKPEMGTGEGLSATVPSPNIPFSSLPQQLTTPLLLRAQETSPPTLMPTAS